MSKDTNILNQLDATNVAMCTCANLRKTTRVVTQAYNDALRPVGLRATQFTVLAKLARKGKAPLSQLAEALVMDRTTLTRNLKPLERRELIRIESEEDQRVRYISLTDAGKQVFEDALPQWQQVQMQIYSRLGQKRWSGFMGDLSEMVCAIQD
jgi:DNA-binding MarR family transcriptional regulator